MARVGTGVAMGVECEQWLGEGEGQPPGAPDVPLHHHHTQLIPPNLHLSHIQDTSFNK